MPQQDSPDILRTTALSLDVVEILMRHDGARVTEVAHDLDISSSTAHGHLTTLTEKGFVIKEGDIYYLGPEFLRLGHYVRTRKEGYDLARRYTRKLFDKTDCRTIFVAEQGGRGTFLHTVSGERAAWHHESIGNTLYLHNTAVGKAMLAKLPDWRIESILEKHGLPQETEHTITDRDELYEVIHTVRERGYATNFGENIEGLAAIGAAATDQSGSVIGAFSVSGSIKTFADSEYREYIVEELTKSVKEYELELSLS